MLQRYLFFMEIFLHRGGRRVSHFGAAHDPINILYEGVMSTVVCIRHNLHAQDDAHLLESEQEAPFTACMRA